MIFYRTCSTGPRLLLILNESSSSSQDNRSAGADEATVGGVLSQSARDSATSLGIGANLNRGLDLRGAISSTVNLTDGGAFNFAKDLSVGYGETLASLVDKQNAAASNSTSLVAGLVDKFSALVESKNTDGETTRNNTFLYIALAAAAVLAIFFWRRAK